MFRCSHTIIRERLTRACLKQVNYLKNNFKIYIKTAPTCFGAVTPSSGSALLVLA